METPPIPASVRDCINEAFLVSIIFKALIETLLSRYLIETVVDANP